MAAKKKETKRAFANGVMVAGKGDDPFMSGVVFSLDEAKEQAVNEVQDSGESDECVVVYELVPLFVVTKKQTVHVAAANGFEEA